MTAEELARKFHESYGRVSPAFFGTQGRAPGWEEISEESRRHLIAVCQDVLGESVDVPGREPVPTKVDFQRAAESVEVSRDALSDWESDLKRQIRETARKAKGARKPFDGIVR